jgi:uncharacterized protein (DUF1684 family)
LGSLLGGGGRTPTEIGEHGEVTDYISKNFDPVTTSAAEADFLRFRQARHNHVTSARGPLALVSTTHIDRECEIDGVPGVWAPLAEGVSGVRVTAVRGDGIVVDGETVDFTIDLAGSDAIVPSTLAFDAEGAVVGTVFPSVDGGYIVRVWDAANDRAESFDRISAYEYDPAWVVTGTFTATDPGRVIGIRHTADGDRTHDQVLPGDIDVVIAGESLRLVAFVDDAAEAWHPTSRLKLVFRDLTTGDTTYDVGRFLEVRPNADGSVVLDFNRAYIPPCAFSDFFNCPMPPPENRLVLAVTAGEKRVLSYLP